MSTPPAGEEQKPLRIAMTGAGGLIGSALQMRLRQDGHRIRRLVRRPAHGPDEVSWDPVRGEIDAEALEGCDAAVHLAGENLGAGRWTAQRKRRILESRANGTALLARTLARLKSPPRVLVSASGVGFYGDRGQVPLTEESGPGTGFLAGVCQAWEGATTAAQAAGIRVVRLRQGIVLAAGGGALPRLARPFRFGLGGRLGHGRQYMSWITIDDLCEVYVAALLNPALHGPVNAVAPNAVTNADFFRLLGQVLGRPSVLRVPAFVLKLALGEMAREMLLVSARVLPKRLSGVGYRLEHPHLKKALRHVLDRA
jgi:uncharacterized protein (TIGR01777 family)